MAEDAASPVAIVRAYAEGQISTLDFLRICRSYPGPAPHFLLSSLVGDHENSDDDDDDDPNARGQEGVGNAAGIDPSRIVFMECLDVVDKTELIVLLQLVIDETPHVVTQRSLWGDGLLHVALRGRDEEECMWIQLLLAVPESTRLLDPLDMTPLHVACATGRTVEVVIHRLLDLDPGVVTVRDDFLRVPLHYTLGLYPTSTHVKRMIEWRPETLLFRDVYGQTPVAMAMSADGDHLDPQEAAELRRLVEQHPVSVSPADAAFDNGGLRMTPLMAACAYQVRHPELVAAVLHASPSSLLIPHRDLVTRVVQLPFEEVRSNGNEELEALMRNETIHMTLAVIEYALDVDTAALASREASHDVDVDVATARCAANVAWFKGHIRQTLRQHVPGAMAAEGETPGLSVAHNVLHWRRHNSSSEDMAAVIRALFCHEHAHQLLCDDAGFLRMVVLSETVVDLYRLNRLGRYYRPKEIAEVQQRPVATADAVLHQLELLASLKDSSTVEFDLPAVPTRVIPRPFVVFERSRTRRRGVDHWIVRGDGRRRRRHHAFSKASGTGFGIHANAPLVGRVR